MGATIYALQNLHLHDFKDDNYHFGPFDLPHATNIKQGIRSLRKLGINLFYINQNTTIFCQHTNIQEFTLW